MRCRDASRCGGSPARALQRRVEAWREPCRASSAAAVLTDVAALPRVLQSLLKWRKGALLTRKGPLLGSDMGARMPILCCHDENHRHSRVTLHTSCNVSQGVATGSAAQGNRSELRSIGSEGLSVLIFSVVEAIGVAKGVHQACT